MHESIENLYTLKKMHSKVRDKVVPWIDFSSTSATLNKGNDEGNNTFQFNGGNTESKFGSVNNAKRVSTGNTNADSYSLFDNSLGSRPFLLPFNYPRSTLDKRFLLSKFTSRNWSTTISHQQISTRVSSRTRKRPSTLLFRAII